MLEKKAQFSVLESKEDQLSAAEQLVCADEQELCSVEDSCLPEEVFVLFLYLYLLP